MRLEQYSIEGRRVIHVTLSKRNLLALLEKVSDPVSMKTISSYADDGSRLIVSAEPDAVHYEGREPAGVMSPKTEKFIAEHAEYDNG